jgi:hypothetical protein
MLVYVRPSNEALLRARVPGAQDQHGDPCLSFSSCAFCEQGGHLAAPSSSFLGRALREHRRSSDSIPSFILWTSAERGFLDRLTLPRTSQIIAEKTTDASGASVDVSEGELEHETARCGRTG